jgi:DNA-binding Lrp family transcriptional regulator
LLALVGIPNREREKVRKVEREPELFLHFCISTFRDGNPFRNLNRVRAVYNITMPGSEFDQTDARLLDLIQGEFPLVSRPFDVLAARLGIAPEDVIERIRRLKSDRVIRQISAIFDSRELGYSSALVAFKVRQEQIDSVGERVSTHSGVSHCYSRDAEYNLWFTITLGPGNDLTREIDELAGIEGVASHMVLPALKIFKIGVFFGLAEEQSDHRSERVQRRDIGEPRPLGETDIAAVRALQKDLPIVDEPFAVLARGAGMTEDDLLAHAADFLKTGIMRRFAAVLRHQRAGYRANAMVCWQAEPDDIEAAGAIFAKHPAVSHCYERPTSADWTYPLYTMIHCRNDHEVERTIAELAASSGLSDYRVLRTVKEYKKSRVVYFE